MPADTLRDKLQASLGTAYTIERELGGGGMSRVFLAEEARSYFYGADPSLPVSLRAEGRVAAATGDRDGTIRAYRRYLVMRQDAEPSFRAHLDGIRRELARLERPEGK